MRPTIFLLLCIIFFAINVIATKSKRRINFEDLTKEDLDEFLENIITRRENDASDKYCFNSYVEESGVILRTRDSIRNGAEFIEAPNDIETADDCKKACCNPVSNKTCDLAVFQQHDDDPSDEQPKCFLFSCFTKNKNLCVTSPNSDYKVLKRDIEYDEKQLVDIATEKKVTNNKAIELRNNHNKCGTQFTKLDGKIIKTQESIKNGAEFLGTAKSATSVEMCQQECCRTVSDKSSRHCDYAIFDQEKVGKQSEEARCFLFSCTDDEGNFVCFTRANDGYVVLQRKYDIEENQLIDMATIYSSIIPKTSITKSTTTATTKSTTTSTTTKPISTASTTTTTPLAPKVNIDKTSVRSQACSRLNWPCDDGNCIKVTEVCNGKFDCHDKSDENGCEVLALPTAEQNDNLVENKEKPSTSKVISTNAKSTPTMTSMTLKTTSVAPETEKVVVETNLEFEDVVEAERTSPQKGAVLPLALGLSVTACVLLMVGCRLHIMKKKMRRRGKPLSMEESDYLINGMYL